MIILPAIDIYEGKCVRLVQGKFDDVTMYGDDPVEMGKKWEALGAKALHVVDLSGAKTGTYSLGLLKRLLKELTIPVEIGGGLRRREDILPLVEAGVDKAIVGTLAVTDFPLVAELAEEFPDKIAVSVDAKDGFAAIHGWQTITDVSIEELAKKMEEAKIKRLICTDISRDGMLVGPNFKTYEELVEKTNLEVVASGGVTTAEDLKKLEEISVYGSIIGKAFYEGVLTWEEVRPWI